MAISEKIEELLKALASRLPGGSKKPTIEAAFRAALDAVPKSKLREKLIRDQRHYIYRLVGIVREKPVEDEARATKDESTAQKGDDQEEKDDEDDAEEAKPGSLAVAAAAAYKDVDGSSPADCLSRCEDLLKAAMAAIRPAARAEEALEGLLGLLPPESRPEVWELSLEQVKLCARLVPLAAAAFTVIGDANPPPAWSRFLGLVLGAPLRVQEDLTTAQEEELEEVAARLGAAVSLIAGGKSARSSLRLAFSLLGPAPINSSVLARIAPATLPVVRAAFGIHLTEQVASPQKASRGELLALLHTLRYLSLFRKAKLPERAADGSGGAAWCSELRKTLNGALQLDFDVSGLVPEFLRLAKENISSFAKPKSLQRRLNACASGPRSAAAAAGVAADVLEGIAHLLHPADISKLATCAGLEVGADEEIDAQAAAARARGDLFFMDVDGVGGNDLINASGKVTLSSASTKEAADTARKNVFEELDGLDALKKSKPKKAESSPKKSSPKLSPKKRPLDASGEGQMQASQSPPGGPKRIRLRRKSSAAKLEE
eukprot:TRINITY_DN108741_c0_g1_i1.p1 TRINITY_DN108741_c0_g1~~TRINITY_DN108741_c0_g1_i1.p1  ORF type:complete len:546 (+),score=171.65 TRINITY_DN108741_c0_g1_i1:46-1683(+)